jgi:glycosyltransferase involved in cell wall biosynthesis
LKIVYLNPASGLGGAERCLLDMIGAVRRTDPSHELHLVVSSDGPLIQRAQQLGVPVTVLPMPPELTQLGDSGLNGPSPGRALFELGNRGIRAGWATWQYTRSLTRTLKQLKPDIVHSNGIKFHLLASAAPLSGAALIWHIHDFLSLRPLVARGLRLASTRASGAIAISQAVQRDAQQVLRGLPVELIYNGIDTDEFSPRRNSAVCLDTLAGSPIGVSGTIRIGLVATFARWKGHEVFLRAAAQIVNARTQPPVRFYIVGEPIYQTRGSQFSTDELRAIVANLNLTPHVAFIPFQRNPADIYRALDIAVHASTQPEPFGRTIVEAMACAKPVVVAQAGGAAELFTHDHDAVGIPPSDPAALAAALIQLISDPARRQLLAHHARQTAVERFNHHRLGPQLLAAYRRFTSAAHAA